MQVTRVGLVLAKHVFQRHGADLEGQGGATHAAEAR
jgi:hypothetical protein